jgi:hypothetical protein
LGGLIPKRLTNSPTSAMATLDELYGSGSAGVYIPIHVKNYDSTTFIAQLTQKIIA